MRSDQESRRRVRHILEQDVSQVAVGTRWGFVQYCLPVVGNGEVVQYLRTADLVQLLIRCHLLESWILNPFFMVIKKNWLFAGILEQHYKEPPLDPVQMNNIFQAKVEEIFCMDIEQKKLIPTIQVSWTVPSLWVVVCKVRYGTYGVRHGTVRYGTVVVPGKDVLRI